MVCAEWFVVALAGVRCHTNCRRGTRAISRRSADKTGYFDSIVHNLRGRMATGREPMPYMVVTGSRMLHSAPENVSRTG